MVDAASTPSSRSDKTRVPKLGWVDRVGAWLGVACLVHCLALPLIIGVLPWIGLNFLAADENMGEVLHAAVHWGAYGFAGISILWGLGRHQALRVTAAFVAALGVILIGFEIGEETWQGRLVMVGGGIGLALAHRFNRRLCESCPRDE